ncbi:MAG TPA: long-chain fatty acid--CoA ligase [Pyrinomonadaceae bacterium]|nr:long-chain fatty acid--CoA ligase [Pyrinomonadaceae bacterium]
MNVRASQISTQQAAAESRVFAEPAILPDLFRRAADEYDLPDALNYRSNGEWHAISARQLVERAENVAWGLTSLGLKKGDRAAILAPNSPEWTIADAGCQFAGVVDVPIYTTLSADSVRYILDDSAARVLFVEDEAAYARIRDAIVACASLEKVVFFHGVNASAMSFAELEDIGADLRETDTEKVGLLSEDLSPDDIATLIYTSGTTGEPKGVMLTHANLISNVIDASSNFAFSGHDIALSVLPLSHVFERTGMYVYIRYGMQVFYAESIDKVPDNLKDVRPTIFIGVPRIFEKVFEKARLTAMQAGRVNAAMFDWAIDVTKEYASLTVASEPVPMSLAAKHAFADKLVYEKFREFFGGRLRHCITGGAALPDEIYLIFTGAGISIMQGYGLTETSPVISSNAPGAAKVGTVGKPIANVSVRIAADGEIEVSGPGVMRGYYHKEEATREAFTADGWFRTGDIGHLDDEGYLVITDRKKELFKTSGGKYIAPSPIEQMLRGSRFISQVVLIGNGRKFPSALIVPNFEMLASYVKLKGLDGGTPAELCHNETILDLISRQIDAHTKQLAQFERIKRFALLERELSVENGELTPTLKIKRRVIEERYRGVIDKLYS